MWQWACFKQGLPVFSALVTVAVLVTVPSPSQARPALGTACASCHGNPTLATSPADSGSLEFGKTLVGQTALQQFTITNATVNAPSNGGGFGGSFPTPAAPFGLSGAPVIVGDIQNASGYLTPLVPSESRSYEYKPTQRGADSTTISFTPANGYSSAPPTSTVTLKGQGVAPLISVTTASAGNVRLGTSANAGVTITNNGDGNQSGLGAASNLNGTVSALASTFVGAGGGFSLADAAATTFAFAFTPTTRGAAAADVTINAANGSDDGQNLAQQINASVVGQGVGPEFSSDVAPGGSIDFGDVEEGQSFSQLLEVSNVTPDDLGELTRLTLLSYSFMGTDAGMFSLTNFTAGMTLDSNDSFSFDISFAAGSALGPHAAELVLLTDQGVALGADGESFHYNLAANTTAPVIAIPEPATAALLAAGLGCLGMMVRRRQRLPVA